MAKRKSPVKKMVADDGSVDLNQVAKIVDLRAEACNVAKEIAKERGGRATEYMKEAWRIVKEDYVTELSGLGKGEIEDNVDAMDSRLTKFREKMEDRSPSVGKRLLSWAVKKAADTAKSQTKTQSTNLNFMKAPKDAPGEVLGGLGKMFTKSPDPINVPDGVKKLFKFW